MIENWQFHFSSDTKDVAVKFSKMSPLTHLKALGAQTFSSHRSVTMMFKCNRYLYPKEGRKKNASCHTLMMMKIT